MATGVVDSALVANRSFAAMCARIGLYYNEIMSATAAESEIGRAHV